MKSRFLNMTPVRQRILSFMPLCIQLQTPTMQHPALAKTQKQHAHLAGDVGEITDCWRAYVTAATARKRAASKHLKSDGGNL